MYLVTQITSDPTQIQTLILPDGSSMTMTMTYAAQQYCWFITSLVWNNFTLQGLQITTNPNMLVQWSNSLTFGLACYTAGNREPTQLQDFESGAAQLFILDEAEVAEYIQILQGNTA
jgi:hypothetical protein